MAAALAVGEPVGVVDRGCWRGWGRPAGDGLGVGERMAGCGASVAGHLR